MYTCTQTRTYEYFSSFDVKLSRISIRNLHARKGYIYVRDKVIWLFFSELSNLVKSLGFMFVKSQK